MKFHKDGTKPTNANVIFVFGSNLAGIHGAGAAREALVSYGAIMRCGRGLCGKSYAIPTKDAKIETMKINDIRPYVNDFLAFASIADNLEFFVTRVGCGLAGYDNSDIAPLFKSAGDNCNFPEEWESYLK
jgi:hypothetical protein